MTESADTVATTEDARDTERILFFPEPCIRLTGQACSRCVTACPELAISFNDAGAPVIDDTACSRCGICIGICDSFASNRITTVDRAKRMERKAQRTGMLYLCCEEDVFEGVEPADNVIVLRCLSSLSPEFLTYLLSTGTQVVFCHDLAYCEQCATGGRFGGKLWQRAAELAGSWTGCDISFADIIPEAEHFTQKMSAPDRRTLLTGAVGAVSEVASGEYRVRTSSVLENFLARRERMRAEDHGGDAKLFLDEDSRRQSEESRFARKILMNEALQNDPEIAHRRA